MSVQSIPVDSIRTLLATAEGRLAQFQPGVVSDRPYYEGRVAALYDLLGVGGDVAIAAELLFGAEDAYRHAEARRLSERTSRYHGGRIHAVRDAFRRGGLDYPSRDLATEAA